MNTFTPAPGAAPLRRQVLTQASMETRLLMRNGEQLLLAVVIPVIVLVGGVFAAGKVELDFDHPAIDVLTPGVLALAVLSTAFTSVAIATGFERRYGVIKRLGSSPLPRHGLLLGKVGALLLIETLQVVVIALVASALGWDGPASPAGALFALLGIALGTWSFAALGLLIAGVLRAEATLAAANLIYLLLMAGGGVVIPSSSYGALEPVVRLLPSGALGDLMRAALLDGHLSGHGVLVLLAWAIVGTLLAARTFRWE